MTGFDGEVKGNIGVSLYARLTMAHRLQPAEVNGKLIDIKGRSAIETLNSW